jgi:hypothetical protein
MLNGKFKAARIVRPLDFSEYAEEYEGQSMQIWVNLNQEMLNKRADLALEITDLAEQFEKLTIQGAKFHDNPEMKARLDEVKDKTEKCIKAMEAANNRTYGFYAEVWSQGEDKFTAEQVRAFAEEVAKADEAFWIWLTRRTNQMIDEHRENVLKN